MTTMIGDAKRMIKQKEGRKGEKAKKIEHIYSEDKLNMRSLGVSMKINHSDNFSIMK
jgi:hypothetical protein